MEKLKNTFIFVDEKTKRVMGFEDVEKYLRPFTEVSVGGASPKTVYEDFKELPTRFNFHSEDLPSGFDEDFEDYIIKDGELKKKKSSKEEQDNKDLFRATELKYQVSSMADAKFKEALDLVADRKLSKEQLERYKYKIEVAKSDDLTSLSTEAVLRGVTVEELRDIILAQASIAETGIKNLSGLIEASRVKLNSLIDDKEFDKAEVALLRVGELNSKTKESDIISLFGESNG